MCLNRGKRSSPVPSAGLDEPRRCQCQVTIIPYTPGELIRIPSYVHEGKTGEPMADGLQDAQEGKHVLPPHRTVDVL